MSAVFNNHTYYKILQPFFGWLALVSIITFCLSLLLLPWLVGRMPQDFFIRSEQAKKNSRPFSPTSITIGVIRNCFGIFLILAGIVMLFLPGQGILTILLGSLLLSFPGKQKVVFHLFANAKIQKGMDWLRLKSGKERFIWPK